MLTEMMSARPNITVSLTDHPKHAHEMSAETQRIEDRPLVHVSG